MYEVFLKCWYQEIPNDIQEEIMETRDNIDDAFDFLKKHGESYIENYPIVEMGIRIKSKSLDN